jgi:predicted aminopeptidase
MTRWLEGRDELASVGVFHENRALRQSMMTLVDASKSGLGALYESDLGDDLKRERKQELLDDLSAAAARLIEASGSGTTNWLAPPLNNARLASLGLYEGRLGVFETILQNCNGQLACFYTETKQLAELDLDERERRLDQLAD